MEGEEKKKSVIREFALSSMAVENSTSVFVMIFLIFMIGLGTYLTMPRENFPEIRIPTVFVGTAYPGNSPLDMENLVTRPLENEINAISGVKKLESTSIQDFSTIVVEFDMRVPIEEAMDEVKDAVDKAKQDLPNDLPTDPDVFDFNFSELPIMSLNISGSNEMDDLKRSAEHYQDLIEKLPEVTRVDIRGVQDKEVVIEVDVQQLEARELSMFDIENAISMENMTMSGGDILAGDIRRNIRIVGEFKAVSEIGDVIVKNERQSIVYLKDVADVKFDYADRISYARESGVPMVILDVVKRSGENLINASDKIKKIVEVERGKMPEGLSIKIVNDTSKITRMMVENLENSIISGVILVVLVLLFFLGLRNAIFVGIAIPTSMMMGFMLLGFYGTTLNMMVLFSLILALGMLVDNGIVVVENIYRLMVEEGYPPKKAAKEGAGEVAWPIITSTFTTLAAFLPLLFWNDIMGEFMRYLPMTLIIVLFCSLFVALIINPVLTSVFMTREVDVKTNHVRIWVITLALAILSMLCYFGGFTFWGSLFAIIAALVILNVYLLDPLSVIFRNSVLPFLERVYGKFMRIVLKGPMPYLVLLGTFAALVGSIIMYISSDIRFTLFSEQDPNYFNVYLEYPVGTDIQKTNELARDVETRIMELLEPHQYMVESVLTQVGEGTSDPNEGPSQGATPNKARITVFFEEFQYREGTSTTALMENIRGEIKGYPGVTLAIEKEVNGPPTGPPINVEVSAENFGELIAESQKIKTYLEESGVPGVEGLKMDLDLGKPELMLNIDREKSRRYGLSMGRIASDVRTAVFGKEISQYKEGEDEYPIQLRFKEENRYDLNSVLNQKVTFRNQSNGQIVQVPISAVADVEYSSTYGAVKRLDLNRVINLYSNVTEGYNATEIIGEYSELMKSYDLPDGFQVKFTGEQEEQQASSAFLLKAMFIAIFLIFLILVTQFNSVATPFIILLSVAFSTIGVFLGYTYFAMDFVIILTGIGIISLAGIVVNNAIVLIDYTNLVRQRKKLELGLSDRRLNKQEVIDSIVEGGSTRLRPVLLTAITTILGLIPLATGFNIDFYGLLTEFEPNIYLGGDNASFWGAMSWTVIFGLTFATFLTLVVVPAMYYLFDRFLMKVFKVGLNTR